MVNKTIKVKNNKTGDIHEALVESEDEVGLQLRINEGYRAVYVLFSKSGDFLKATNFWGFKNVFADWEIML